MLDLADAMVPVHLPTMSVPEAGKRYFGLGRQASYAAAAKGDIPTVRVGGRLFVPIGMLNRLLCLDQTEAA